MSGLEFIGELRRPPGFEFVPVVVLSASDAERDRATAYASRVDSYPVKPLDREGFQAAVRGLCLYWGSLNAPCPTPPMTATHPVILAVEDDDEHFALLVRLLRRTVLHEHLVVRASSFSEAVRLLDEHDPLLVLLDLGLPDSTVRDTLDRLHHAFGERSPVVVMSGLDEMHLGEEAIRRGAMDYLVKGEDDSRRLERSLLQAVERGKLVRSLHARNRELDRFARLVSHDLKTPLSTIMFQASMLTERLDGDEAVMARGIVDDCSSMADIIDSLLSYARSVELNLEPGVVNTDQVVSEASSLVQATGDHAVDFAAASLPPVVADASALRQALQNLLANAYRFADADAPVVRVSGESDAVRGVALLRVEDNGAGIDPSLHEKAFEMFDRLGRDEAPGMGVGLAIVRRLINAMSGRVWIERSNLGGASLVIELPAPGAGVSAVSSSSAAAS